MTVAQPHELLADPAASSAMRNVSIFEAAMMGVRITVGPRVGITHAKGCELYYQARGWRRPWVLAWNARQMAEAATANEIVHMLAVAMRRKRMRVLRGRRP